MLKNYFFRGTAAAVFGGWLGVLPALAQNQPSTPAAAQPLGLASDSLTLGGTLQAVLDANPSLTNLTELTNAASSRLAQTQSGFLPQITGTATYTRIDPVVKLPFNGETLQFVPNNNYDFHLTAQYLLYDFGKNEAGVKLAESQVQTAEDNVVVGRRDLAFAAAQSYYNVLFMRESIRVQDQQIASLRAHRNEMNQRVEAGVSTKFDVTTTDVRITQAQNTRLDLENQLRNQQVQLGRLLHRPASAAEVPVKGRLSYEPQPVDVAAELAKAALNRPEVKLARDAEATAALQSRLLERSNMPSLGVGAQMGGKNGYILPNIDRIRFNTLAVAQLSVPIYDGGRNQKQRVEAQANARATVARTADVQEQIRADVRQAANNLEFSQARYDNAAQQVAQATEALTKAQARYRYGVGGNLDVLDAETQLALARLARAQATYNYTLGQFQLRRATGEQIWK